jgi:hypothetical protein
MEKNLKRRQRVEGKTRSWREDKEMKEKQRRSREESQVKKMKVTNLMT